MIPLIDFNKKSPFRGFIFFIRMGCHHRTGFAAAVAAAGVAAAGLGPAVMAHAG